ncbi:DUF302 domain-containing protein [Acidithiobacillus acidisediminis]|uniref:DUF302 domain-containing protein n=1 Tax=Acidithiobacillus TaxID=119977 RepID=UPI00200D5308|nr:DUF302 domain-containing protein [Acidithiobacillus sp. S30A2]
MHVSDIPGLRQWQRAIAPATVLSRAEAQLVEAGFTLFDRIDHAQAAKSAGLFLPFCVVLIFGRPSGGTELMRVAPTLAIDLPSKMLIYECESNISLVAVTELAYTAQRHGLRSDRYLAEVRAFDHEVSTIVTNILMDTN